MVAIREAVRTGAEGDQPGGYGACGVAKVSLKVSPGFPRASPRATTTA